MVSQTSAVRLLLLLFFAVNGVAFMISFKMKFKSSGSLILAGAPELFLYLSGGCPLDVDVMYSLSFELKVTEARWARIFLMILKTFVIDCCKWSAHVACVYSPHHVEV